VRLESCGDIDRGPRCVVEFSRLLWMFGNMDDAVGNW
jgi:hypothetical protein